MIYTTFDKVKEIESLFTSYPQYFLRENIFSDGPEVKAAFSCSKHIQIVIAGSKDTSVGTIYFEEYCASGKDRWGIIRAYYKEIESAEEFLSKLSPEVRKIIIFNLDLFT